MMIYEQYQTVKRAHPNAVLLMQVGDFYQAFDDDARTLANVSGGTRRRVTLGKQCADTCGVPAQTLDATIQTLLDKGHRVAVAQRVCPQDAQGQAIERLDTDARMVQPAGERIRSR